MKFLVLMILTLFTTQVMARPKQIACSVAIKCAAPPKGCEWTMEVDKLGCISGCGELSCEVQCPAVPSCAAPPEGCNWTMETDPNGCVIGCGELKCEPNICPMAIKCAAPPENCNWSMEYDENKCPVGCGQLVCDSVCNNVQAPVCASPPVGCNWSMTPGEDGCPSCGQLICEPAGGGGYEGPKDGPSGLMLKGKFKKSR